MSRSLWTTTCQKCGAKSQGNSHPLEGLKRAQDDGWRVLGCGFHDLGTLCEKCVKYFTEVFKDNPDFRSYDICTPDMERLFGSPRDFSEEGK